MSFEKNGYTVIKKAISPEIADFVYKYFLLKRKVKAEGINNIVR